MKINGATAWTVAACAVFGFHHAEGASVGAVSPPPGRAARVRGSNWSWRTVPVFAETSNVSGVFDTEAMATLAKFPLFVGEKAYDFAAPGFAEEKLAVLAKKLRGLNPSMRLVFYYNANLDLTDYKLYNLTAQHAPDWWLRDENGKVLMAPIDSGKGARPPFPYNANSGGVPVYDFSVAALREAWVQECFDVTSPAGGFDGCMVDRWTRTPKFPSTFTPAAKAAFVANRNMTTSTLAARANAANVYLVGEGLQVDAISDPGYGYGGAKSVQMQLGLAAEGQGLLASYGPGSVGTEFTTQLAMFLIGAGEGHYFGAGSWTCNATSREGVTWHPEYDLPLGPPLGLAKLEGTTYTRRFQYGTNVTFDTKANTGTIAWGAFP